MTNSSWCWIATENALVHLSKNKTSRLPTVKMRNSQRDAQMNTKTD